MAIPTPFTNPWVSGFVDAAAMYANTTDPMNQIIAAASLGYLAADADSATVTLAGATGTDAAGSAHAPFTLAVQRRVLIVVMANVRCASSAPATYFLRPAYNTGSTVTVGSATKVGADTAATVTTTGDSDGRINFGTALLAAGDWIAYGLVNRNAGGSTSDTIRSNSVLVLDIGGS